MLGVYNDCHYVEATSRFCCSHSQFLCVQGLPLYISSREGGSETYTQALPLAEVVWIMGSLKAHRDMIGELMPQDPLECG